MAESFRVRGQIHAEHPAGGRGPGSTRGLSRAAANIQYLLGAAERRELQGGPPVRRE
jgi:hypothetical protein